MKKRFGAMLLAWLLLAGCCAAAEDAPKAMFTDRDGDASFELRKAVRITLSGTGATASDASVQIDGGVIRLTREGTYLVSGTLEEGMLIVDAPEEAKVQIVLDGAQITSATASPLYIRQADKVFLTLAEGTENTLANGGSFQPIDDANLDAAIFARCDLTVNGMGRLAVTSPAGHGVAAKDDLAFSGGSIVIEAASHGVSSNDSVRIRDTSLTVTAGKDGIQAENAEDPAKGFIYMESGSVDVKAEGDGFSAGAYLNITGGTVTILAGGGHENGTKASSDNWGGFGGRGGRGGPGDRGGRPGDRGGFPGWGEETEAQPETESTSMKGLKAAGDVTLTGGAFTIDAADDAIHTDASATISGGTFTLASGDDAIHAEDTLTVTGGTINITSSYEGLEALHIAVSGGDVRLVATDDGLNAAGGADESGMTGGRDGRFGGRPGGWGAGNSDGTIVISGGTVYINASGDGIDANGSLQITGGQVTVTGPTQGDTAVLDYDLTGEISGGTFIGTGSAMMAQSLTSDAQGVLAVSVGRQSAGTRIIVQDVAGQTVLDHTPDMSFQVLIFSSPAVVAGEAYTLAVGTASGTITAE